MKLSSMKISIPTLRAITLGISSIWLFTAATSALAADYTVDASHSSVGFAVKHITGKVKGGFKEFEGNFSFDPKDLKASKVSFTAKAASISTDNTKRDDHLKGEDFFDVAKHPTLTFESKKITAMGKNKYKLEGTLTIHGQAKPAVFDVEYNGGDKDPWGGYRVGFSAKTQVKRKDFGLTWNKLLDSGGFLIGEDVAIELEVEGVQKAASEKKPEEKKTEEKKTEEKKAESKS